MAGRDGEIVINLRRNNLNTPWGFRLQGGKEFNTYLSVQRVFNGSPADGHLQRGDLIVAVNNENVTQWYQNQAQDLIQSIGLTLALVVRRGGSVPYVDDQQPPRHQTQQVPSFVRNAFGQQPPHPQQHQQQPLSPQLTSKTSIQFQPSSYTPTQPSNDIDNYRPLAAGLTWTPQQTPSNTFSNPLQVRIAQPPQKPYAYSPQQSDSFSQEHGGRAYQPPSGEPIQTHYQQDYSGGERTPYGRDHYQREQPLQPNQQSNYDDSNHVAHDRSQNFGGVAHHGRNEPTHHEGGREEGEEEEDYQQMSVRDIKQMFNKPDQKDFKVVSRVKQPQKVWTRPSEESLSPGRYAATAPGPRPGQPSNMSPRKPTTGSIHRGPPPSDDDYRKPYSPEPYPSYTGQPHYESSPSHGSKPKTGVAINKQGGAYAGIIQPALPTKPAPKPGQKGSQQKKKDFDPNQSAVYKILLEEEERAKREPQQKEEEEEDSPRRAGQGQRQGQAPKQIPKQPQGSRLNELLERDAAQIAPYKDKSKSSYQDQVPYHQEARPAYQEPARAPYRQEPAQPSQSYRSDARGPATRGGPVVRQNQPTQYGGYDHTASYPQTQYVDGIPTSDF